MGPVAPVGPAGPVAPLAPTPSWLQTIEYSLGLQTFETLKIPVFLFAHPEISIADALVANDKVTPMTDATLNITTDFKGCLNEYI
jgi:hypothetical protein